MVKTKIDKSVLPFAAMLLIATLLFWKVVINPDKIIYSKSSDTIAQFAPWKFFISETIKQYSQIPLWDPHNFGGTPFLADFQSSIFYPLNIPMYFNFDFASFGYRFLLDVLLAGIFTYLFARELKLPKTSSLVAATIFMLSLPVVSKIYAGHLITVDAISLTPLGFLLIEKLANRRSRLHVILLGLFAAVYFLGGNIQHFVYSMTTLFLYYIVRTGLMGILIKRDFKNSIRILSPLVVAMLIFIGLSSFQLFPSYELSKSITRTGGVSYSYAVDGSLPAEQIITFLIPSFFGLPFNDTYWGVSNFWEVTGYFGIASIFLLALAFIDFRDKNVGAFIFLLAFSFLFSLGTLGLIFPLFYHIIPFFDMFRIPARFLFITAFSAAILAGIGSKNILENKIDKKLYKRLFRLLSVLIIVIGIGIVLIKLNEASIIEYGKELGTQKYLSNPNYISRPLEYYLARVDTAYYKILSDVVKLFLISTAIATSLYLVLIRKLSGRNLVYIIIGLIALDLISLGMNFIDVEDVSTVYHGDQIINFLKSSEGNFRIHNINFTVLPEMVYMNNFRSISGYNPLEPRNYMVALDAAGVKYYGIDSEKSLRWLGILNTKYIISDSKMEMDGLEEVLRDGSKYVYVNKFFEDIVFVAFDYELLSDKEIIDRLNSGTFNSSVILVSYADLTSELPFGKSSGMGMSLIKILEYTPNKIELSVTIDKPGFLIFSDNYYPGWTAYVDGKESTIIKAYSTLKSVWLEAGEHSVVFSFFPSNLNFYLIVTIGTIIVTLVFYYYRRH